MGNGVQTSSYCHCEERKQSLSRAKRGKAIFSPNAIAERIASSFAFVIRLRLIPRNDNRRFSVTSLKLRHYRISIKFVICTLNESEEETVRMCAALIELPNYDA